MDSLQLKLLETSLQQVFYSQALGKSSMWLLGNACLLLLFIAFILFFAVLNYRQRKIAGVEEKRFIKLLSKPLVFLRGKLSRFDLREKVKKYSFYIEFGVCALFFTILTHFWIPFAIFSAFIYILFRLFLFKKVQKIFSRKPGVVVPVGIYVLYSILLLLLLLLFNVMPAMIEVTAENDIRHRLQEEQ
jgi:hypothetical protein